MRKMDLELEILLLKKEILELKYGASSDRLLLRYNENHDPDNGQFTSGPGGSSSESSEAAGSSGSTEPESSGKSESAGSSESAKPATDSKSNADSIDHLQGIAYADAVIKRYIDNPKSLGDTTPQEKYDDFIAHGVKPLPLGHGSADGIAYESGGGYRVTNLPDGGCFLYHPEKGSHHGGAYYKLSSGKNGTHRFDMSGNIKKEAK